MRYQFIKPRSYTISTEDGVSWAPSLEVDGPNHVDTGLVTQDGMEIWRTATPVGFIHYEDE